MDRVATLNAVREKYPQYRDMSDDDLARGLAEKYPQYADLVKKEPVPEGKGDTVEQPNTPEQMLSRTVHAGQPKPLTTLQKVGNAVLPPAAAAPTMMAGGAALPAAPVVGEALVAAALGGGKAASKGESPLAGAFLDGMASLAGAGVGKVVAGAKIPFSGIPSLRDLARRVSDRYDAMVVREGAFKWAAEAPMKAYEAIKDRLPAGKWMYVPTLGGQRMTAEEAARGLGKLKDVEYKQALGEMVSELERFDIQRAGLPNVSRAGPRPYAGQAFKLRVAPERFTPKPLESSSGLERAASTAVPSLESATTRGLTEAAAAADVGGPKKHIPAAVPIIGNAAEDVGFSGIASRIKGLAH